MTTVQPTGDASSSDRQSETRAGLTARFLLAVGHEVGADGLTPAALARAATSVLPVDGAGLSTMNDSLRVPLGSSSDDVSTSEELQSTLGEGPCLDAAQLQAPVVLSADDLGARWPLYTAALTARTAYRSVASIPLRAPNEGVFAALDLYSTGEELGASLDVDEIDSYLGAPAAALLSTCLTQVHDVDLFEARPEWYESAAGRRHNVWVAIGMIMAARPGRTYDALSLLRAHAYAQERSLDDLAADVVGGRVAPTDLVD